MCGAVARVVVRLNSVCGMRCRCAGRHRGHGDSLQDLRTACMLDSSPRFYPAVSAITLLACMRLRTFLPAIHHYWFYYSVGIFLSCLIKNNSAVRRACSRRSRSTHWFRELVVKWIMPLAKSAPALNAGGTNRRHRAPSFNRSCRLVVAGDV